MIKVVVLGAGGRMGRRVIAAVVAMPSLSLAAAVERGGAPELGEDAGTLAGIAPVGVKATSDLAKALRGADVAIDFTSPAATKANAAACAKAGVAMVIGTTGLEGGALAAVEAAAKKVPVVKAANFSIGVNALLAVVADLTQKLEGYDVEIVEIHHKNKVDAPSGTALRLAEAVAGARKQDLAKAKVTGRAGQVGARRAAEIGVLAVRGGDVVGDHTVYFLGPGERIEITHRAHSRDTFAAGAARAAAWVKGRAPRLYEMREVLGR